MNLALTDPVPWNCWCPSLQDERGEFRGGVCDLSPFGPHHLILALPSWLAVKKSEMEKERQREKGENGRRERRGS